MSSIPLLPINSQLIEGFQLSTCNLQVLLPLLLARISYVTPGPCFAHLVSFCGTETPHVQQEGE